ncbi:MAG: hypothetical protein VX988_07440 [Planctomycetota bacterium]|nr:hypothetical protein [Planctomycetota bacterium]
MNCGSRPRRRGLAPLELVLALPLMLFVMALFINAGTSAAWKVRAQGVARDAIWRTRWPRNESVPKPQPASWPRSADMDRGTVAVLRQLDEQDLDLPVARGATVGNARVNRDLLDPTAGGVRGEASIERPRPLLPAVGGDMEYDLDHPLIDGVWTYDKTNLSSDNPAPYRYEDHFAYEEYGPQWYENLKMRIGGNDLRRMRVIYDFGETQIGDWAAYERAVAETERAVQTTNVLPLSYWITAWEGADRYGDPDFSTWYYTYTHIDPETGQSRTRRTRRRLTGIPRQVWGTSNAEIPEFHPQLRTFCERDSDRADEIARQRVDYLIDQIRGSDQPAVRSNAYTMGAAYRSFYQSAISVVEQHLQNLRDLNAPASQISQVQAELNRRQSELEPRIEELTEFLQQL